MQNEVGQTKNSTHYELLGHPSTITTSLSQSSSIKNQAHSETARDAELTGQTYFWALLTGSTCPECSLLRDVMCC